MADIMGTARSYAEIHKRACGDGWDPGAITHAWTDDSGDVCVSYESGVCVPLPHDFGGADMVVKEERPCEAATSRRSGN